MEFNLQSSQCWKLYLITSTSKSFFFSRTNFPFFLLDLLPQKNKFFFFFFFFFFLTVTTNIYAEWNRATCSSLFWYFCKLFTCFYQPHFWMQRADVFSDKGLDELFQLNIKTNFIYYSVNATCLSKLATHGWTLWSV